MASTVVRYEHNGSGRDVHMNVHAFSPSLRMPRTQACEPHAERVPNPLAYAAFSPTRLRTDPVQRYWPDGNGRDFGFVDRTGKVGRANTGTEFRASMAPERAVCYRQRPKQRSKALTVRERATAALRHRAQLRSACALSKPKQAMMATKFEHVLLQPAPAYVRSASTRAAERAAAAKLSYLL